MINGIRAPRLVIYIIYALKGVVAFVASGQRNVTTFLSVECVITSCVDLFQ